MLSGSDCYKLPKFDNFVDNRVEVFQEIQIDLNCQHRKAKRSVLFYSIVRSWGCSTCASPVVIISSDKQHKCSYRVAFPIGEEDGLRNLECVWLEEQLRGQSNYEKKSILDDGDPSYSSVSWRSDSTYIAALNETHLTCNFEKPGIYAVLSQPNSGALVKTTYIFFYGIILS